MQSFNRPLGTGLLLLVVLGLYWFGATQQLKLVNTKRSRTDQQAYMNYARLLHDSDYGYTGNGNRVPLYPFLQSLHYHTGMDEEQFFLQGKYVNLVLSIVLLAGIFLLIRPIFRPLHTLNFMLITVFTVFIFKAGFFQAELLFYFLSFFAFVLLLRLLKRPSFRSAILAGLLIGAAHITKASVLPGLVLFLIFFGAKGLYYFYRGRQAESSTITPSPLHGRMLVMPMVTIFFLLTIFPYISSNKRIFGRYFYNVNSTFYIWYDSWEEAREGTNAHGDRRGWPDMPPEEIPSLTKYLREHTVRQIVDRFWTGGQKLVEVMSASYGYLKYVLFYLTVLTLIAIRQWRQTRQAIAASPFRVMFAVAYFVFYLLLYAWYTRINDGNRFVLALFLPLMYAMSLALHSYKLPWTLSANGRKADWLTAVNLILVPLLVQDIYLILTQRIDTMYGGW